MLDSRGQVNIQHFPLLQSNQHPRKFLLHDQVHIFLKNIIDSLSIPLSTGDISTFQVFNGGEILKLHQSTGTRHPRCIHVLLPTRIEPGTA